jgi:hypothetical protein
MLMPRHFVSCSQDDRRPSPVPRTPKFRSIISLVLLADVYRHRVYMKRASSPHAFSAYNVTVVCRVREWPLCSREHPITYIVPLFTSRQRGLSRAYRSAAELFVQVCCTTLRSGASARGGRRKTQ